MHMIDAIDLFSLMVVFGNRRSQECYLGEVEVTLQMRMHGRIALLYSSKYHACRKLEEPP